MKELKFRVWNNDRMIYAEGFDITEGPCIGVTGDVLIYSGKFHSKINAVAGFDIPIGISIPKWEIADKNYISMQFTGFNDKHGVPIYESDILEVGGNARREVKDLVEFLMYCGAYKELHGVDFCDSVVVVGNVYEVSE